MLVLTRTQGETIVIGDDIRVTVVAVHGSKVRLGVTAPPPVGVDRLEVRERRLANPPTVPAPARAAAVGRAPAKSSGS
jgi:carbon storage regulator